VRKKKGGSAKQAYAADAEPSAPEAEPEWSPWMAWGASVQPGGDALDAFAIYTEDGPELRPTTVEQRDTTPAARAKGEATWVAARAKEEKGRLGGPRPGFKPKGEREAPAAEGDGQATPTGRRRQAPEPAAAPPARATRAPPGFGEYRPNDPRYQGLTDAEQVGVRVELLDPPRTGPVTGDVVRRRDTGPAGSLSAFHADVLLAEEAEAAGGAAGGTGGGPANVPPLEEMGGRQVPDWEAEKQQRRANARNRNHEGELGEAFVINEKPHTPLLHEGEGVPWKPTYPLTQKGLQYVQDFLTAVAKSIRDGKPSSHGDHTQGANIMPQRSGRRHGSWSYLKKPQRVGFLCHLGREWVDTYANLPDGVTGERRFSEEERTYRLEAMQYLVADMEAHYATLPNQPNLREIWASHERLVLPPSQRGPNELTREFTVVYPDPDWEAAAPGTEGRTKHKDLGAWQSYMAWEYGTDWVAGFLAHRRRYVAGPPPANVNLWPTALLTHPESEELEEEEGNNEGQGDGDGQPKDGGPQGVSAPFGPVMAPSIVPPTVAPTVPTTGWTSVSAPPADPTVAPTPVATSSVPVTL
jgi:hypothetical protein